MRISLQRLTVNAIVLVACVGCGGKLIDDATANRGDDAGAATKLTPPASSSTAPSIPVPGISSSACILHGQCLGSSTCSPCSDRCDPECAPLACVGGLWRNPGNAPPLPADCAPDASAPSVCTLPPVDVGTCVVDSDCTVILRGCFCGARPADAVNVQYASIVNACEVIEANQCLQQCLQDPTRFLANDGAQTTDLSKVEAYCDQLPESGTCATRLRH